MGGVAELWDRTFGPRLLSVTGQSGVWRSSTGASVLFACDRRTHSPICALQQLFVSGKFVRLLHCPRSSSSTEVRANESLLGGLDLVARFLPLVAQSRLPETRTVPRFDHTPIGNKDARVSHVSKEPLAHTRTKNRYGVGVAECNAVFHSQITIDG
ncbi:hypothetical protein K461DRAFT_275696 [Myriangium duriaei CBS 260.36]|uniref:Uncharacterized protein n=1 Tax=Myriangium duriaei CBS 260.36 TaxID=1168546 RepID=A0A9P4J3R9_9PEZI|nr:hypothetical protein K461DRAFT_275696 [Myriangium duriaei CBS 260.36]